MKDSIVAMLGWIIPTPLADPPTVTTRPSISSETAASFSCVSVVMIDRAKSLPPSSLRRTLPMFWRISAIGSSTPIMPVLATSTSSSSTPACRAASAAISCASSRPCSPTQQFAHPLFATTDCAVPLATRCRLNVTDGDSTLFVVKVPAAAAGVSDTTTPRSRFPLAHRLQPGERPAGPEPARRRNPAAPQYLHHPSTCRIPRNITRRRISSHHPAANPTNRKYTIRPPRPVPSPRGAAPRVQRLYSPQFRRNRPTPTRSPLMRSGQHSCGSRLLCTPLDARQVVGLRRKPNLDAGDGCPVYDYPERLASFGGDTARAVIPPNEAASGPRHIYPV